MVDKTTFPSTGDRNISSIRSGPWRIRALRPSSSSRWKKTPHVFSQENVGGVEKFIGFCFLLVYSLKLKTVVAWKFMVLFFWICKMAYVGHVGNFFLKKKSSDFETKDICNEERHWYRRVDTVDGSEILHRLRLVLYPIIYRILYMPGGWPWDFWTIKTVASRVIGLDL